MKFFEVSSFCVCTDLRTGGLIIGYVSLVLDIISFILGYHWILIVPDLLTVIPILYGIHKNSPVWMLPAVIFSFFQLLLGLLSTIIIIPLCYLVFWDQTKEYFIQFAKGSFLDTDKTIEMKISIWLGVAISTVLHLYITAVLFSLYKLMKNENERRSNGRYDVAVGKV